MTIETFVTIERTYHKGELIDEFTLHFSTEELRDDYFVNILRWICIDNGWVETGRNTFENGEWACHLDKTTAGIIIIDKKDW